MKYGNFSIQSLENLVISTEYKANTLALFLIAMLENLVISTEYKAKGYGDTGAS